MRPRERRDPHDFHPLLDGHPSLRQLLKHHCLMHSEVLPVRHVVRAHLHRQSKLVAMNSQAVDRGDGRFGGHRDEARDCLGEVLRQRNDEVGLPHEHAGRPLALRPRRGGYILGLPSTDDDLRNAVIAPEGNAQLLDSQSMDHLLAQRLFIRHLGPLAPPRGFREDARELGLKGHEPVIRLRDRGALLAVHAGRAHTRRSAQLPLQQSVAPRGDVGDAAPLRGAQDRVRAIHRRLGACTGQQQLRLHDARHVDALVLIGDGIVVRCVGRSQLPELLDPLDVRQDAQLQAQLVEVLGAGREFQNELGLRPGPLQGRDALPWQEARLEARTVVGRIAGVEDDAEVADEEAAEEPLLVAGGGHADLPPQQEATLGVHGLPILLLLRQGQHPRPVLRELGLANERLQLNDIPA
mmetsp:Transcript_82184/g.208841  ORF Transcript_82184/g.208841 Transcript_82184/m.208841 type:complete len:409 (-) Transcript_82184:265-1491(-)